MNEWPPVVEVSFFVDAPYWYELESSAAWAQVAEMIAKHQTTHLHSQLQVQEAKSESTMCIEHSATQQPFQHSHHYGAQYGYAGLFQFIWKLVCNRLRHRRPK